MKNNGIRLLLIGAAALLVSLASQPPALALSLYCPPGYTGPESLQDGCCLSSNKPKAIYDEYSCVDGVAKGPVTKVCSTAPCPV
jgi:hypothetical protein